MAMRALTECDRRAANLCPRRTNYCKWWEPDGCDANDCWMYGGNPSIGPVRQPGIDTVEGWQDGSVNWNDQMASWICYVE